MRIYDHFRGDLIAREFYPESPRDGNKAYRFLSYTDVDGGTYTEVFVADYKEFEGISPWVQIDTRPDRLDDIQQYLESATQGQA